MEQQWTEEFKIETLIIKQRDDSISADEKIELDAWLNESPDHRDYFELWTHDLTPMERLIVELEIDDRSLYKRISKAIKRELSIKLKL